MNHCKFCFHDRLVKNGNARGRQRYRCKHCYRSQIDHDRREKHPNTTRRKAVALQRDRISPTAVARMLGISPQIVRHWSKKADSVVLRELQHLHVYPHEVSVIDVKELAGYLDKKRKKEHYVWLFAGTEVRLVRLRTPPQIRK